MTENKPMPLAANVRWRAARHAYRRRKRSWRYICGNVAENITRRRSGNRARDEARK